MSWYDEIEIEDMTYDSRMETFYYPCPCGDRFQVAIDDLLDGSTDTATCPSCSLTVKVIFEPSDLDQYTTNSQRNMHQEQLMV